MIKEYVERGGEERKRERMRRDGNSRESEMEMKGRWR